MQLKLGLGKEKIFLLLAALVLLGGCSEREEDHYEAFFLNQSGTEVLMIWKNVENNFSDTITIVPNDTATALKNNRFPLLQGNGLRWSGNDSLYDIRLVFYGKSDSSRCLLFEGSNYLKNDIRNIKAYENIGECDIRGNYTSDAMLYRITEDMLESAGPCE